MTASDLEITGTAHLWSAARRRRTRSQALAIRSTENDCHPDPIFAEENLHRFPHHRHDRYLFGLSEDLLPSVDRPADSDRLRRRGDTDIHLSPASTGAGEWPDTDDGAAGATHDVARIATVAG
jgi:hypothetical protein